MRTKWEEKKFISIGLDSSYNKIPQIIKANYSNHGRAILKFNQEIIDATADITAVFKPNSGFYEAEGPEGWKVLAETITYIHRRYPDIPVILDAKKGDIGNTNKAYAKGIFDVTGADAVTINPYLGKKANQPWLSRKKKGNFFLCRTSNPGAGEFQDLPVNYPPLGKKNVPLYLVVAHRIASWNENGNCGLVVGATYPDELKRVREVAPSLPILIPGIGHQGGDVGKAISAGKNKEGGIIVNSSRGIIYASTGPDFAKAARKALQELNDKVSEYI